MTNEPLVTVNILSYNRKEELKFTLNKVFEQDYKNIEVIVVDNASTDGTAKMIQEEFAKVKLIELENNIGIAGWNKGFEAAKGEYVLVLDDDSYPSQTCIEEGLKEFLSNRNIGIIGFNIQNTRFNKSETENYRKVNPYLFTGCGAIIKKDVINIVGYYDSDYFIYYNEIDYSIRTYNAGFEIRYLAEIMVYHNQSSTGRWDENQNPFLSKYRYRNYFIGQYLFLIKHFNIRYSIMYAIKWMLNRFIICLRYRYYFSFIKSFITIISKTPGLLKNRTPVSIEVQKFYNNGNMSLIDRWYFPNFRRNSNE